MVAIELMINRIIYYFIISVYLFSSFLINDKDLKSTIKKIKTLKNFIHKHKRE